MNKSELEKALAGRLVNGRVPTAGFFSTEHMSGVPSIRLGGVILTGLAAARRFADLLPDPEGVWNPEVVERVAQALEPWEPDYGEAMARAVLAALTEEES